LLARVISDRTIVVGLELLHHVDRLGVAGVAADQKPHRTVTHH
jgi:hypothetical protein